jgi:hypothetical protein
MIINIKAPEFLMRPGLRSPVAGTADPPAPVPVGDITRSGFGRAYMSRFRHGRQGFRLSRRQAITAATIGAGLTAGTAVGVASAFETPPRGPGGNDAEPVVVRVVNAASGTIEVFAGDRRVEVRDKDLAARLVSAARKR